MKGGLGIIIFLFFLSVSVFAQEPAYWQLSEADGLPSLTVYQTIQDPTGYIWFATASGLCRFDGERIQNFTGPEITDKEIIALDMDKWGRIWANNLSGQLIMVNDDSLEVITLPTPFNALNAELFFIDGAYLWILNSSIYPPISFILACFELTKDTAPKLVNTFEEKKPKRFRNGVSKVERGHFFWFLKDNNIHLLEIAANKLSTQMVFPKPTSFPISSNHQLIPIADSKLLIQDNQNLVLFDIEHNKVIEHQQSAIKIQELKVGPEKELCISTTAGIKIIANAHQSLANTQQFFKNIVINTTFKDRENNLWLGTSGDGVIIVPDISVEVFNSTNSDLADNEVFCIKSDQQQTLIGHNKGTLTIFDNEKISKKYDLNKDTRIVSIACSDDGLTWLGCDNGLRVPFYRIVEKEGHRITGAIKEVIVDENKTLWVATSSRVSKVRYQVNPNLKKIILAEVINVFSQRTYALHKDFDNVLWIGSVAGLFKYSNNKVDTFKENSIFKTYRVSDIVQTADSTLWVATYGDGLLQIKQDSIVHKWDENSDFPSSICTSLFADGNDLWVGTNRGMTRMTNGVYTNQWIDSYDGLPSNEVRAVYVNQEGVWVGTPQGLAKFPLAALQKNDEPPVISITEFQINDQDTTLEDHYRLTFKQCNLSFAYLGFAYRARGDVNYRYRLKGLTEQWTETKERNVTFFTLSPGDYQFEVEAVNEDGVSSIKSAKVVFTILKPWWRQLWFQIGSILVMLGLSSGIVYWRQRDLRNREKTELEFRDRINNLRLEALQTQMNPHFIFNALNAIQGFLITNDREQAIHYLSSFARMIRQVFDYSRRKTISLEEEIDFLNLYLELEKLRFGDRVIVIFEIESTLKKNITEHYLPPLLIQPIIENAFKHGLMHKKENSTLKILFELVDDYIKCTVEDDGIGREKVRAFNQWRENKRKTSGLKATEERLEIFHQNKEIKKEKYLIITDLYDQEKKPTGTKVEIYI